MFIAAKNQKAVRKTPKWSIIKVPKQPDEFQCGYYVMKYMKEIIDSDAVETIDALQSLNIVHGDIKPDNLLITSSGKVKIVDFRVNQVFEDDDELRCSPGTPICIAPECCIGVTYNGRLADTWTVGVTLYCYILGKYPFLGETLQDTYDKIVNNPLLFPDT